VEVVGPSRDGGAHDYGDAGMGEGKKEAAVGVVGSHRSSTDAAAAAELLRDPTVPWRGSGRWATAAPLEEKDDQ